MSFPHYQFSGTSYEQGLAHGESLKILIEKNVEVYINRFKTEACIEKNELLQEKNELHQQMQLVFA